MPLAAVLGRRRVRLREQQLAAAAVDPEQVALIGARSVDPGERDALREAGVAVFPISDVDRRGVEPVLNEALERVSGYAVRPRLVDLDLVDPVVAPGVGSPVTGGFSYREAHLALELVLSGLLTSLELVGEPNPRSRERSSEAGSRAGGERAGSADLVALRWHRGPVAQLVEQGLLIPRSQVRSLPGP